MFAVLALTVSSVLASAGSISASAFKFLALGLTILYFACAITVDLLQQPIPTTNK